VSPLSIQTHSPEETEALGSRLGNVLHPGAFLALRGELGGGKTCFTRGIVSALAPESSHLVASPTFAIMNEYPGRTPVYHFDFYRLGSGDEIIELGFEDYFQGSGVCVAEWSERLGELTPADCLLIRFEHSGDETRTIVFEATGLQSAALIEKLAYITGPE